MTFSLLALLHPKACVHDLKSFITLCDRIGLSLHPEKPCLPNTNIIIYGTEVDSVAMEYRLPNDKVLKIQFHLTDMSHRKKVTCMTCNLS